MTIPKSEWKITVFVGVLTGIVGDAIWDALKFAWNHSPNLHLPHDLSNGAEVFQLLFFIFVGLVGVFLGRMIEREHLPIPALNLKIRQSKIFVLEVNGSQPLDSPICDWQFFLTNCTNRILRRVELDSIKSDLGTYLLGFHEIAVMQPGEKVQLAHKVWSRRMADQQSEKKPTLWDFANDVTSEGRSSYFWYKTPIEYREAEDDTIHCGDFVFVCFDLPAKRLKTEGVDDVLRTKGSWRL